MTLDEILKEINKAEKIVILTHEAPDGDAIGSSLAMQLMIEEVGKKADVIIPEYPRLFVFLPNADKILKESDIQNYDLAIALDCADEKRIAERKYFDNSTEKIVIDHHGTNKMYGDLNFVNPVSPACCEILAEMFQYYNIKISKEIGSCLLTGIITDTGGFWHENVNPETFEFTADLIRIGVKITDIYKRVLRTNTRANFELNKIVSERMEFLEEGKVAFTYIDKKDEEAVDAEPGDHEGLVEIGRAIEGVEVSIFIRQKDDTDKYKVSMRSGNKVNVSDICLLFGGGGHPRAARMFNTRNSRRSERKNHERSKKGIINGWNYYFK